MLLLIVVLAGAVGLFYYAGAVRNHGSIWADQFCAQTSILCEQPRLVLIVFSAVVIVGMLRVMTRA